MRYLVLLPILCACTVLSQDDLKQLASYQSNAQYYYEGGRLEQALGQIERGLELEPDDYKLTALKGAVLLRASGSASGTDHKALDEATGILAGVYERRSPARHEPYLLLNYGLALQKQGLRHLGEAIRLGGQADRAAPGERQVELMEQATEERRKADELLEQADEKLAVLVDNGQILRIAHKHRLQIARQLGRDEQFEQITEAFLEQSKKDQDWVKKEVERTTTPKYEAEQYRSLQQMQQEEIEVRAMFAEYWYQKRDFQKALAELNHVLELDPQRSVDYYNRGRVLVELDRAEAAKADFRRFLATSPLPATSDKKTYAVRALQL